MRKLACWSWCVVFLLIATSAHAASVPQGPPPPPPGGMQGPPPGAPPPGRPPAPAGATLPFPGRPAKQGLYDPWFEHDACGVGFVVHIKGKKSHDIIEKAITILVNLDHRGACGCEANTGAEFSYWKKIIATKGNERCHIGASSDGQFR